MDKLEVPGRYAVVVNFQASVFSDGTRTEAEETANRLAAHVEITLKEAGISTERKTQLIRRVPTAGVDNDEADAAVPETSVG